MSTRGLEWPQHLKSEELLANYVYSYVLCVEASIAILQFYFDTNESVMKKKKELAYLEKAITVLKDIHHSQDEDIQHICGSCNSKIIDIIHCKASIIYDKACQKLKQFYNKLKKEVINNSTSED